MTGGVGGLCTFFDIEKSIFEYIIKNKTSLIRKGSLPKRHGGFRTFYQIIDDPYRNFLTKLRCRIADSSTFPECVHGFLPGKSITTNAQQHLGKQWVINADIKNFFESINKNQIQKIFNKIGCDDEQANILADLVTVHDVLATGFSTSPIISNVICAEMDADFLLLAADYQATYTRYGDDLSISGNGAIPSKNEIEAVIKKHGYEMNQKKFRIQKKGGCQYVTGLTVCDKDQPHLPRRLKRRLRLESYYMTKNEGATSHTLHHMKYAEKTGFFKPCILSPLEGGMSISGWIYFSSSIDKPFARWLRHAWKISRYEID